MTTTHASTVLAVALIFFSVFRCSAQENQVRLPAEAARHTYVRAEHQFTTASVNPGVVAHFLLQKLPAIAADQSGLAIASDVYSPGGRHITFYQTFQDYPIFGATVKVNLKRDGKLLSILDNSKSITSIIASEFKADTTALAAQVRAASGGQIWRTYSAFHEENGQLRAVCILETFLELDGKGRRYFYDAGSGELLRSDNRSSDRSSEYKDGNGQVFAPDPLTTACVEYDPSSIYHDNGDYNSPFFEQQYIDVALKSLYYERGVYHLRGPYVEIADIRAPNVLPAISYDGTFKYDRSVPAFEQVNIYYHIHSLKERINTHGFEGLVDYPIRADAQGTTVDNSFFTSAGTNSYMIFGTGGVDDAEDADVIIHEYGHALSASGSPNSLEGYERKALDEGIGDFFAASWSRGFSECRWADVFTWDGHNTHWAGRTAQTDLTYNNGQLNRNKPFHIYGQIWSSALMTLWGEIGQDATERLQLQQLYLNNNDMSLRDAARTLLDADEQLYNGAHSAAIRAACCQYDLLPSEECGPASIQEGSAFAEYGFKYYPNPAANRLFIELETFEPDAGVKVFDITGKLYYFSRFTSYKNDIDLSEFAPGVYITEVGSPGNRVRFKFIKAGN